MDRKFGFDSACVSKVQITLSLSRVLDNPFSLQYVPGTGSCTFATSPDVLARSAAAEDLPLWRRFFAEAA